MKHTTHRHLIEAAVAILSDGTPRTASGISRAVREELNIPHRADRMNDVLTAAMGEGVVKPGPRIKGSRSVAWTLGDQPLPDWLFVRERPVVEPVAEAEPEPLTDAEMLDRMHDGINLVLEGLILTQNRLDAIESRLDDLTADRKPRPLFDAVRRNGH